MSSFPKKKKRYQKVPLAPTADDDDAHSLQLATPTSSSTSSLRSLPDDIKTQPLPSPLPPPRAYTALSAACSQLLRHRRLPLILRRAELVVEGYRRKRNGRMAAFNVHSLADLAATTLDDVEGVTLMDYTVRQVYTLDLPTDPYTQSSSAPSLLSSLTLLPLASVTPLPRPTSPPDPLHAPTASLLSSTMAYLFPTQLGLGGEGVSAVEFFTALRRLVEDWKYSERKLGLKLEGEEDDEGEEVEDLDGWLEGSAEGDDELAEEDEGETMSMRDFLGGAAAADIVEEEEEEEEEKGEEVRIDVRRRGDRPSRALEEEEEVDEVTLDDLKLDDEGDDDDGI